MAKRLPSASRSPRRWASPPLLAPNTTAPTPAKATTISAICLPLNRSPNNGTATTTITSGVTAPITAAMASDVSWNDANPSVCATANASPPGIATRR